MAPESYRDEKCTEKIDIYSLSMLMSARSPAAPQPRAPHAHLLGHALPRVSNLFFAGEETRDMRWAAGDSAPLTQRAGCAGGRC